MSDVARVFVGVWPPDEVRDAVVRHAAGWSWPRGAALVRPDKLHMTLHFLGDVARERLPGLMDALAVSCQPFELRLERGELWPGGIAVLAPSATPEPLLELHARLGQALDAFGIVPERRKLRAHVTLARRAQGAVVPAQREDIVWSVDGFALLESDRRPPSAYRILRSYPGLHPGYPYS
ncbi:MAG TPA: RNA 2',3'-cyclic phosphodiesterase [Albitalea sp.]|uniref:RNA 2',3'-cyclic phosphodiesterase n=1 Tax=Piscinibacter sp. TaxID=1903157 RepID=UPI002ED098C6